MRTIGAWLLCSALAGAQDAGDFERFAEQFETAVAAGQLEAILDLLPAEAEARLSGQPEALQRMAASGAKWAS
jgi:hypothetical protein